MLSSHSSSVILPLRPPQTRPQEMKPFIPFLLFVFVSARYTRDLRRKTKEEEPFSVQNDLFSQALSLSAPDDVMAEEEDENLRVTSSDIFTGPTVAGLATALPPGYSPQPPGFQTEEEATKLRETQGKETTSSPLKFRMTSGMDDEMEENDEQQRELRNFRPEIFEENGLVSLKTTLSYDNDDVTSPSSEGSGTMEEEHDMESTTILETHAAFNFTEETNVGKENMTEAVRKVYGEAGTERGCEEEAKKEGRVEKKENTIDVDTFLVAGEGSMPLSTDFSMDNSTLTMKEECGPPQLCAKNCFVSVDGNGCQVCECLWQALTCESDSECPEASQRCDLGKCDCIDGFIQDMSRSGMCKVAEPEISGEDLSLESLGVEKSESITQEAPKKQIGQSLIEAIQKKAVAFFGNRHKREAREKPRSMERLQWPGVCDPLNRCPSPLVCIQGDCWQLPDKPIRKIIKRRRLRDSVPDSFIISSDDWSDIDADGSIHDKLYPTRKSKTMRRFVGNHPSFSMSKELLERTTMEAPPAETVNSVFDVRRSTINGEEPQLAPSFVSELYTSTHITLMNRENEDDDEDLPPAPPPEEIAKQINNEEQWPKVSREDIAKAFTKMIELPKEEVLKPLPRTEKKTEERVMEERKERDSLDSIEFPISSQLEELRKEGIHVEPPKALSVSPTAEELESKRKFEIALEERRKRRQRLHFKTSTIAPPMLEKSETRRAPERKKTQTSVAKSAEVGKEAMKSTGGEHLPNVWYPMEEERNIRRSPKRKTLERTTERVPAKKSTFPVTSTQKPKTTTQRNEKKPRRPVKIDSFVGGRIEDECSIDKDCGPRFLCCTKAWCDQRNFCSKARFCLPSCSSSKLIQPGRMDIVYD